MISRILNPEATAWIAENRARMEAESEAWMGLHGESFQLTTTPYPTTALEQMLMAELTDCLGEKLLRPFVECLVPVGGWPKLEEAA